MDIGDLFAGRDVYLVRILTNQLETGHFDEGCVAGGEWQFDSARVTWKCCPTCCQSSTAGKRGKCTFSWCCAERLFGETVSVDDFE